MIDRSTFKKHFQKLVNTILGPLLFVGIIVGAVMMASCFIWGVFRFSEFAQTMPFLKGKIPLIPEPSPDYVDGAMMGIMCFLVFARITRFKINFDPDGQPPPEEQKE